MLILVDNTLKDNMKSSIVTHESDKGNGPGRSFASLFKRIWHALVLEVYLGTKLAIIETFAKHNKLSFEETPDKSRGKTIVITGGARGIGAEVVMQCLHLDMNVIIGCRKLAAGESLLNSLRQKGITSGTAEVHALDLNSLSSVRQFAQTILNKNIPIHVLINNAGVMAQPFMMTGDDFESQFQINYLSHFLLTILLQPALHQGGNPENPSRVVNVSSVGHYGGKIDFENIDMRKEYSADKSYMNSKLMQVVSTIHLNKRYINEKLNIRVYAVSPGVVLTDLNQYIWWTNFFRPIIKYFYKKPEQGADGVIFVALSPTVNVDGGTYYQNCRQKPVNPVASDPDVQELLYELSARLCGEKDNNIAVFKSFNRQDLAILM